MKLEKQILQEDGQQVNREINSHTSTNGIISEGNALMFVTFSGTDALGGNGFLAIYICSVYLGNQNLIHKKPS